MTGLFIIGAIFAVVYIIALAGYYDNVTNAEDIWERENGEIPDGYCLVYKSHKCYLKKI